MICQILKLITPQDFLLFHQVYLFYCIEFIFFILLLHFSLSNFLSFFLFKYYVCIILGPYQTDLAREAIATAYAGDSNVHLLTHQGMLICDRFLFFFFLLFFFFTSIFFFLLLMPIGRCNSYLVRLKIIIIS
jgi:hypothetical protein